MDNFQKYITEMKIMHASIITYIENDDNSQENFQNLINIFNNQNIQTNYHKFKLFLCLISNISNNHHRTICFFDKIGKILTFLKQEIKNCFYHSDIFDIFKDNKRILLILFEENILIMDDHIFSEIKKLDTKNKANEYTSYFNKEIQQYLNKPFQNENFYEENRNIGENDSYVCKMIREDLIDDFIVYVNRENLPLSIEISSSLFDTNSFLIGKSPSLIEYSAFFGSIQIFQYLRLNNVELTPSLWLYTIHGQNPEMIHLLEEYQVKQNDESFLQCILFSIKCHHNDIANYFMNSISSQKAEDEYTNTLILKTSLEFHNYSTIPNIFDKNVIFFYLCKYNYFSLVDILIQDQEVDINAIIV